MENQESIDVLREFIEKNYHAEVLEAIRLKKGYLTIDFKALEKFDKEVADILIYDAEKTLKDFSVAASEFDTIKLDNDDYRAPKINIRVSNISKDRLVPIRNIRSKHINKLIVVEGNIKSRSPVRPQVENSKWECPSCGNVINVIQIENSFREPTRCNCGRKGKFTLISTIKIDFQYISVEEPFDQLEEDSVPQRVGVMLTEDLTDPRHQPNYIPGKPIRISGVLKEVPIIKNGKKSRELDWIIEANHVEGLEENLTKTTFTDEEIAEFKELSKDPKLYDKLVDSVAPHIYGHREVKEAMLLFLVKGVRKQTAEGNTTREYFHVLLMGDPGAAKSQLGSEIELLSWRSSKVVGRGASGPGLTASAEKDEVLGMRVLQAGALAICNEGHIVVDEVDKMDKDVQSHMHQAMEDGQITINKSQVQGTLKARTSVFMIGNPKYGRYDPFTPVIDQIELPKALFNRFDLIFPIKDIPDEDHDRNLAEAILGKHLDFAKANERPIDLRLFKNYLCYVGLNIKPKLTLKVARKIQDYFLKLRPHSGNNGNGKKGDGNVGISGRQLDGLVRMAEAAAKLHMHDEVTEDDADIAIRLMDYSMQAFGTDPETGKIDIDRITSGFSASQRSKIAQLKDIINDLDLRFNGKIPIDEIQTDAQAVGFKLDDVDRLIEKLNRAGDIFWLDRRHISKNK